MRISSEVLSQSLDASHIIYGLFGTEQLLIDFSLTTLYHHLREYKFTYKVRFDIGANTNMQPVIDECNNISLFGKQKIIELRISSTAIKVINGLKKLFDKHLEGIVLVIIFGELTWQQQKSKWFTQMSKAYIMIEHKTIEPELMPNWLEQTALGMNISLPTEVAQAIAKANAYNLLSAYNELQKIQLTYDETAGINIPQMLTQLNNNSKYGMYNLIDSALLGKVALVRDIYAQGNFVPMHLVYVLYQQLQQLITIHLQALHTNINQALYAHKVWQSRISIIKSALHRNTYTKLQKLLITLGRVERSIKGRDNLVPEQKLLDILVSIAT